MRLLGAHMSVAGGLDKAIERGQLINCAAIQIFVKNNNQWFAKPLAQEEIKRFKIKQKETGIFVFAHAGYLINLATNNPDNHKKSIQSMLDEIERCEAVDIPFVVVHPGSHLGQGEEVGINKVAQNIKSLLKQTKGYKTKIALEITAGQGTNLGSSFEQLAAMLEQINQPERMGVCFDTCHAFAAGYDLKTTAGYKKTWADFDKIIGLDNLLAFHLNDSKQELGSHKDRHEQIGQGSLGKEAFSLLMNDKRFKNTPMVLETYKGPDLKEDVENLKLLKSLIK